MKLALVVHDFDPGLGQGRYAIELAGRFAAEHEITVFANTFAVPSQPGWRFVHVPAWRRTALSSVLSFVVRSERLVRGGHHDLIHAQGLTCWSADVITAHVCNAARTRIAPPRRFRSRLFPAVVNPLERRFYRQPRARQLIAISRHVAAEVAGEYGWRRPVTVIPHGVDAAVFRPPSNAQERRDCRGRFRVPSDGALWLFVGEAAKGLSEAVCQLTEFPSSRLLAITRSQPEPYLRLARTLGVDERFHFWGPSPDVATAYRAADLFVYPSTYDTFGMVVAEALASGLPTMVGREVGAAEFLEDGRSGILFDPRQPDELTEAIRRVEGSVELAGRLAKGGREAALRLSWDECAARTLRVYRDAFAGRAPQE